MTAEPYVVVTDWRRGDVPVYRIREVRTGTYIEFEGSRPTGGMYGSGPASEEYGDAKTAADRLNLPAPRVVEGPSYAETAGLPVKDLVPYLRVLVSAKLVELKSIGAAPRSARVYVSYDGPAYCATLNVRLTAAVEWTHAAGVVREFETLRQSFNRETTNTSADGARYYGSTWIEGK